MREYVVLHNGFYLQETSEELSNGLYLAYRLKDIDKATKFHTLESALAWCNNDLGLNLNNVSFIELTTITTQITYVKCNDEYYPVDEVEECSVCGARHHISDMQRGVIDRETGVELMCNGCYEEADVIVKNQELDELGGVFGEQSK